MILFESRALLSNEGSQPGVCDFGSCRLSPWQTSPASLGTVISGPKETSKTQGEKTWSSCLVTSVSGGWASLAPHAKE